jgi:hypothetical protein
VGRGAAALDVAEDGEADLLEQTPSATMMTLLLCFRSMRRLRLVMIESMFTRYSGMTATWEPVVMQLMRAR